MQSSQSNSQECHVILLGGSSQLASGKLPWLESPLNRAVPLPKGLFFGLYMGVIQNCLLLEMDPPSGRGAWHPHRSKRIITCRCDPVGCDSPAFLACPCRHGQCHFARKRLPNHFDLRLFDAWEKIFPKLVIYIPCHARIR